MISGRSRAARSLGCVGIGNGLVFAAMVMATAFSSGLGPLRDAAAGAVAPSDFVTDYVPAARRWRHESTRVDVASGNAEAMRLGAPGYADIGVPFGAHPPPAVTVVAALVPLGFRAAALVWLALSLVALGMVSATVVTSLFTRGLADEGDTAGHPLALGGVLLVLAVWPPVLHNVEKGQWSLIIAGLLAGAWWAVTKRHDRAAGAMIALAGAFKIVPLLPLAALLLMLPAPRARRAALGALLAGAAAVVVSTVVLGPRAWLEFLASASTNTRGWQTGPANTLSIWGALSRVLVGGPYARAMFFSPGARSMIPVGCTATRLAAILWICACAGLTAITVRRTWHRTSLSTGAAEAAVPDAHTHERYALAYAAWNVLTVLVAPLSWTHSATMLVLPAALIASIAIRASRSTRPTPVRPWAHRGVAATLAPVLALAVVVLTIPRATLYRLAGPWPVSPGGGLLLGLHAGAALVMLTVSLVLLRTRERPAATVAPGRRGAEGDQ